MNFQVLTSFAIILAFCSVTFAETCPDVPFVKDFQHKRFLGKWYGVQSSLFDQSCLSYDISATSTPHKYQAVMGPLNINNDLIQVNPNDVNEGFLEKSPLEVIDNTNLKVFATDYDNYVGLFECKNSGGVFYTAVSFGSRTGSLKDDEIALLKSEIAKHGIDATKMKVINQKSC